MLQALPRAAAYKATRCASTDCTRCSRPSAHHSARSQSETRYIANSVICQSWRIYSAHRTDLRSNAHYGRGLGMSPAIAPSRHVFSGLCFTIFRFKAFGLLLANIEKGGSASNRRPPRVSEPESVSLARSCSFGKARSCICHNTLPE